MFASARMNQYERGKHALDWLTVERLALILEVPVAYFYAEQDDVAELLLKFHALAPDQRKAAIDYIDRQ